MAKGDDVLVSSKEDEPDFTLPEDYVWLLKDKPSSSGKDEEDCENPDSRDFGPVLTSSILGRVYCKGSGVGVSNSLKGAYQDSSAALMPESDFNMLLETFRQVRAMDTPFGGSSSRDENESKENKKKKKKQETDDE